MITTDVTYKSVRAREMKNPSDASKAKIIAIYSFDNDGFLNVIVQNLTSEIMVIDQTMSFFVDTNGSSISYYDPTVRTQTTTDMSSTTTGVNVNLGSVASIFGVGGVLGGLLSGVNVGGSGTGGQALSNTTYFADQPTIKLAPKSRGAMSKKFPVSGLCDKNTALGYRNAGEEDHFSVCISYKLESDLTPRKIVTDLYVNSSITQPVASNEAINEAVQAIYQRKPDALTEPLHMMFFNNDQNLMGGDYKNRFFNGAIIDFQ